MTANQLDTDEPMKTDQEHKLSQIARAPLDTVMRPLQGWRARRQRQEEQEENRRKAIETELSELHERLWSRWPDIVDDIRDHVVNGDK